jgi:ketosteroid isomerase-like protein
MRRVAMIAAGLLGAAGFLTAQAPGAWQSLVDAERAFAADAVRTTTREAFLGHLHPQSVMFNPGPVNGITLYSGLAPRPGQLNWGPEVVDVAASGDFGYSTGPHQFRATPDGKVVRQGYFCSVWVRSASEPWKVLIDLGTSQPESLTLAVTPRDPTPAAGTSAGAGAAASLAAAERQFASALVGDQAAAYRATLASHGRVNRDGAPPAEGIDAALAALARRGAVVQATPDKTAVASSGDMGYAYGRLEIANAPPGSSPIYYVRVWRHDALGWRIVLDVDTWRGAH